MAVSSAQAWTGLVAAMHVRAAVLSATQEEDPPPEVIQHGLTMLAEGERFSEYDLWAIAVTIESPEYTVIANTEGWLFQGGDMVKIGKDLGQYCEVGEPVGEGVYWNQSEFAVYLVNAEDSNALIKVAPFGLLSIGLTTDMRTKVGPGSGGDGAIVCRDGYSACCIPSVTPAIRKCLSDTNGDFSACEGGGLGASSCDVGDRYVKCRDEYFACCDETSNSPTYLCLPNNSSGAHCEGGGQGAESCDLLQ
ncbi:MAG: hypothetical protein Q9O74_06110 [Planctomycetota bacterium]|nr:hypothetical protein [Planctomycetota bacterium]